MPLPDAGGLIWLPATTELYVDFLGHRFYRQHTFTNLKFFSVKVIQRLDMSTERKLLTIDEADLPFKGYRCFLALTDRIHEEKGDFFLQPHRTSVVWGGQKALFIFEHHSGEFGLYYDLQTPSLISEQSGGGSFETCMIVMKNRIFIPIPPDERKRFEVRCDILHIDQHPRS